ncbi:MAG: DEAD/DEAH box helicase, partial [Planctomycetes bacterium]|nr:DEAD/DEAH box helicase [Planctomycetota bacterium]
MKTTDEFPGPIDLAERIAEQYRRYLRSTFQFKDLTLRSSFAEALEREGSLVNGPFLEAAPLYQRGLECQALLRELLGRDVDPRFVDALTPMRRLYTHQEKAIRRVREGRNVVVATGTGSGKTEAYLYPILLDLYERHRTGRGSPGVRALVLYPMNALAEDQRQRLGRIAKQLEEHGCPFHFTFGRYTGETPEHALDHRREAKSHLKSRLPGELVLRSEMRESPPDILLTNYSMLEYLLLRPDDSPLFDEGRGAMWRFVVLDEAHQYRGTKGLEMGMLLRRLKDRLRRGGLTERLRCIATSASLGGPGDGGALAQFATELFDELFEADDILVGEQVPFPPPSGRELSAQAYVKISHAIASTDGAIRERIERAAAELEVGPMPSLDDQGALHR